jgi:hypothetical protein
MGPSNGRMASGALTLGVRVHSIMHISSFLQRLWVKEVWMYTPMCVRCSSGAHSLRYFVSKLKRGENGPFWAFFDFVCI